MDRFFPEGVAEQARESVAKAKTLMDLMATWRELVMRQPRRSVGTALRVLDQLFMSPFLRITPISAELGTSYNTAQNAVLRLVDAGILEQLGAQLMTAAPDDDAARSSGLATGRQRARY